MVRIPFKNYMYPQVPTNFKYHQNHTEVLAEHYFVDVYASLVYQLLCGLVKLTGQFFSVNASLFSLESPKLPKATWKIKEARKPTFVYRYYFEVLVINSIPFYAGTKSNPISMWV